MNVLLGTVVVADAPLCIGFTLGMPLRTTATPNGRRGPRCTSGERGVVGPALLMSGDGVDAREQPGRTSDVRRQAARWRRLHARRRFFALTRAASLATTARRARLRRTRPRRPR